MTHSQPEPLAPAPPSTRGRSLFWRGALPIAGVLGIVAVLLAAGQLARWYYRRDRADWIPLNRGSSDAVRQRILAWTSAQFGEGRSVGAALIPLAGVNPRAADSVAAVLSLSRVLLGVWVVDANERIVVGRRIAPLPVQAELLAAVQVARSQRPTIVGPLRFGASTIVTTITPGAGRTALLRRLNADSSLFQLADWGQRTTNTAQTILLATFGDSVAAVTPLRLPLAPPTAYRRSRASASPLWRFAFSRVDTSGYFTDERGQSVLASVLSLGPVPWSLVVQIDENDIMESTRGVLEIGSALMAALVAFAAMSAVAAMRSIRAKRLGRAIEEEARFRRIVSSAMDAIVMIDADCLLLDVNPAALELFAAEAEGMVGTALDRWLVDETDNGPATLVADIRQRGGELSPRLFRVRGREPECFIEVTGSATRAPDGRQTVTLFVRDITQRRHIEEAFRRRGEIALMGRVAGGLAHEFNNVLHVVSANAEFIRDDLEPSSGVADCVDAVLDGSRRLTHLTSQLLSFGRKQMLRQETTDLRRFIKDLEPAIRAELAGSETESSRTLRVVSSPVSADAVATVRIDRIRLTEAVLHLVANAREAMPVSGQLTIEIVARHEGGQTPECDADDHRKPTEWCIMFRDTGVGMTANTLARAREPFFSTRPRAVAQGLGLAVVEGTAEQSGGAFLIESSIGKGTTATICLPGHEPNGVPSKSVDQSSMPVGPEPRRRALVVDDEPAVRLVVARCLRRLGYETSESPTAEHALTTVEANDCPDLVVSDLVMPGMSGTAFRKVILEKHPGVPVLLISGYTDDELARRGLGDPAAAFLQKPFTIEDLSRAIEELGAPSAFRRRMDRA